MGKQDFADIYFAAQDALGRRPTIRVCCKSDKYRAGSSYAGMIIYSAYGKFAWKQGPAQGIKPSSRASCFYVLILCTDDWAIDARGGDSTVNAVHTEVYQRYFGSNCRDGQACCGGFAMRSNGKYAFSSGWLNTVKGRQGDLSWDTDGSRHMCGLEEALTRCALSAWRRDRPGVTVQIPDQIHHWMEEASSDADAHMSSDSSQTDIGG